MGRLGFTEFLLGFIVIYAIILIPRIFYLLTLQNTFNEVKPENRRMESGMVWLALIPLFGLIWQFIIVNKLADSLKAEFARRSINVGEDRPGISIGQAYCILNCCGLIPFLGILASIGGFVCWIVYWVRISGFRATLISTRTV